MKRWTIWKLRDYGSAVRGPDTEPTPGLKGVEAVRSAEVEVVPADQFDSLLTALQGEAEYLDTIRLTAEQESLHQGAHGNQLGEFEAKGIESTARHSRRRLSEILDTYGGGER